MKDYASMSDQEINMHVASIIYPESTVIESKSRPPCACITGRIPNCWVGYCNNPADAWPIITENRIGIIPAQDAGKWKSAHREVGEDDTPYHFTQSDNPLRAAMIVFLMMKESEND